MYRLSVPIMNMTVKKGYWNDYLTLLKKVGAQRVWIAIDKHFAHDQAREAEYAALKENISFFEGQGFEVGAWIPALGYGGASSKKNEELAKQYTKITSITGHTLPDAECVTDPGYFQMMKDNILDMARAGAKMIMLDDDFCLSVRPGIGCACERHMRMFCEAVGEEIQREQLPGLLFCGGENKYRGAWMKIMGDSLLDFARKLRCALDKEFPQVRMGFCSGFTSWDLEGVDAITLTKALAGNTKPFLRLMGAPYWVTTRRFDRQSLQNIIEHVRLQETWCENQGVEIFSEADCYPRPRNQVPAAQTECFESALRVEGIEGGLKYMLDYVAPPLYETGYVERHLNNLPVTTALESLFQDKEMEGIRVYEYMREIEHKDYPQKFIGEWELMTRIFKRSQTILSYNAIPTKYKGGGVGICFGESAKYVEKSAVEGGLVLDMPAAKILRQRGFDTGFLSASPVEGAKWEYENGVCFHMVEPQVTYFQTELKPQATVHSCFVNDAGSFPGLYTYRGKDGCRFAVLAFDADTVPHHSNLLTSYLRQRQLAKCYEFLCGKKLPACTYQNPGMYLLCSKKDGALSVGLWNLHEDIAFSPKIYLGESYKEITCVHCSGKLQGDQVTLSDIPPYGFCGFEVK